MNITKIKPNFKFEGKKLVFSPYLNYFFINRFSVCPRFVDLFVCFFLVCILHLLHPTKQIPNQRNWKEEEKRKRFAVLILILHAIFCNTGLPAKHWAWKNDFAESIVLKLILWLTSNLWSNMDMFTLHNSCVSCSFDFNCKLFSYFLKVLIFPFLQTHFSILQKLI